MLGAQATKVKTHEQVTTGRSQKRTGKGRRKRRPHNSGKKVFNIRPTLVAFCVSRREYRDYQTKITQAETVDVVS